MISLSFFLKIFFKIYQLKNSSYIEKGLSLYKFFEEFFLADMNKYLVRFLISYPTTKFLLQISSKADSLHLSLIHLRRLKILLRSAIARIGLSTSSLRDIPDSCWSHHSARAGYLTNRCSLFSSSSPHLYSCV